MFVEPDPLPAIASIASVMAWLLVTAGVFFVRSPPRPPVGRRTLELGPEPPALANFLVHDFRVTGDALPATVIDLAARNVVDIEQRGPGVFYVRVRPRDEQQLTDYERLVLGLLAERASDGVVPAEALTTGPESESKRWHQAFTTEVVEDAQARGLSVDSLGAGVFYLLMAAAATPALLVGLAWGVVPAVVVAAAATGLLSWMRGRHDQRETPAGLEAASRWLGVRAELAENEVFSSHSPLTVELWSRLLSYGAALGVASGASRPLPMGVESDTRAWSAYGGRWRLLRISYPHVWPPAWGTEPLRVLTVGLVLVVVLGMFVYLDGFSRLEDGVFGIGSLAAACVGIVLGASAVVMAASDWRNESEVTGAIVRLRARGDDDDLRYYVAVDDGSADRIRALRIGERLYRGLAQGEEITIRLTPNLGCVRWIVGAESEADAGVG